MTTKTLAKTVQDSVAWLANTVDQVVDETLHFCRIPAPTFDEAERAAYVVQRMHEIGLSDVQTDAIQNVTGILCNGSDSPTTLVTAHIDTVFPRSTPLQVRQTAKRLYGPSIGDNSVAVAGMLHVATAMQRLSSLPPGRVIFAASVGEEGLGNLCGIRALLAAWQGQIGTIIAVEGHGVDEIRSAGIGSTRLEIHFQGPGGHSWGAFGTPSAIHALGLAIQKITKIKLPQGPKATYNVGLIEGGESINTIAPQAKMWLDLRSVDPTTLQQLETQIEQIFRALEDQSGVQITSRVVGKRPAAALPTNHPICQNVQTIRKQLRLRPAMLSAASTDANLPLSQEIPAVCLGITRGAQAHTVDEYIDIAPIGKGLQQLFLTILYTLLDTTCSRWKVEKK
ncbi:MAG: M20/M25/M40 family metallo-hydrolase [bacterium]|nr:M20/M25/M40 family metallo-hydrolase [bacterium]